MSSKKITQTQFFYDVERTLNFRHYMKNLLILHDAKRHGKVNNTLRSHR